MTHVAVCRTSPRVVKAISSPEASLWHRVVRYRTAKLQEDVSFDTPNRSEVLRNGNVWNILGKGQFGVVIPGKYKDQRVAVKLVSRKKHLPSLLSERNAIKLSHPNIVKTLKVVDSEEPYGLVLMERNGINLQQLLEDTSFQWTMEKKLRYALHIALALDHCHAHGVLHLDVKPNNVLLSLTVDVCKLCDFGSSVKVEELDCIADGKSSVGINTVQYTAPELFRGRKPSTKADVYSFAITLWHIFSHRIPYQGSEWHTIIYKVVASSLRPTLPAAATALEQRYLQLCQLGWHDDALQRPAMVEIINYLEGMQTFV